MKVLAATLLLSALALGTMGKAEAARPFAAELMESQSVLQTMLIQHKVVIHSKYYPLLQRIRNRLMETPDLAADMAKKGYTINFVIVHADQPNAFATAGGIIFVTDSLLSFVRSEDELTAVLAHEAGHVVLGHMTNNEKQIRKLLFATLLGDMLLRSDGQRNLLAIVGTFSFLNFDRQQEYQADHEGTVLLAQAHIDPWAMNWTFQRMGDALGDNEFESYLGDHPSFRDRRDRLHDFLKAHPMGHWSDVEKRASALPRDVPGAPYLVLFPSR